ncbi:hypothetical protein [Actinoplanes sp. G11-F43]|uniref:hypothetical protein n=1 Tax=Actinoplanes sp. G11-F43 TaxID=3424130 RepID=UPI003D3301FB
MTSPEEWTPMDRTTADSMLRGHRTGHALDPVLSAVRAPGTGDELAGEEAAMAAFRAAAGAPAPHRRKPSAVQAWMTRMMTLKVAAVAFATSATVGGVALSTNNGAMRPTPAGFPETSSAVPVTPKVVKTPMPASSPSRRAATPSATPKKATDWCTGWRRDDDRSREHLKRDCRPRSNAPSRSGRDRDRTRSTDRPWPGGGGRDDNSGGHDDTSGPPRR